METTISLNKLDSGFYVISMNDFPADFLQLPSEAAQREVGIIQNDWQLLPFLSLKDNLLLGVKKKQRSKLPYYLMKTEVSLPLLMKKPIELTRLDKIKLQLVRQLLQKKDILLLHHCYDHLEVADIQWLLPFCQKLAQCKKIKIFLFSSDPLLEQTPYIDHIFKELDSDIRLSS